MSLVSELRETESDMWVYCPACGERVLVDEDDYYATLEDGNKEYFLYCPECNQGFYTSKSYI